jgi:hypothetical protein
MKKLFSLIAMLFTLLAPPAAHAVDGCQVTLCIAGNWRNISVCVPPVRQAMHDAAMGRGWPSCSMSSGGSSGTSTVTSVPTSQSTCPPMYANYMADQYSQHYVGCRYTGVVSMTIDGQPWSTMYWDAAGNSVTEFSDAAKAKLGSANYDSQYDDDLAAWIASHPDGPPDDSCVRQSTGGCVER